MRGEISNLNLVLNTSSIPLSRVAEPEPPGAGLFGWSRSRSQGQNLEPEPFNFRLLEPELLKIYHFFFTSMSVMSPVKSGQNSI